MLITFSHSSSEKEMKNIYIGLITYCRVYQFAHYIFFIAMVVAMFQGEKIVTVLALFFLFACYLTPPNPNQNSIK